MDSELNILLLQETNEILRNTYFGGKDTDSLKDIKFNTQKLLDSIDEIKPPRIKWCNYIYLVLTALFSVEFFMGMRYMIIFALAELYVSYTSIIRPWLRYKRYKQITEKEISELLEHMGKIDEILKLREISKEDIIDVEFREVKDVRLEYVENLINEIRGLITSEHEEEFKEILDDFGQFLSKKPLNYVILDDIVNRCEELYNKVNVQEVVVEDRPRARKI